MADIFNGANTSIAAPSQQAPKKNAHSDSAINSLAKSGGLVGVGKKIASDFTKAKSSSSSSGASSLGESASIPTTMANLEF